ncbi:hypothetical protein CISIN_1g016291mg [Citrus sinensis]|uniref:F-box domain-containing protein n=1 Tax=Citrus sinensis TaxID=2711 RepID=A0A067G294_CITSI|nr:hypothetical protein CISIN_1g016291mg [Citrus sinensis]
MARFSDLPEELVVEILAYLPADSLMRFKCVQKSWYSLIAKPKFVVKQLCNQIYNKSGLLLKCRLFNDCGNEESILSFLSFDKNTEMLHSEDHVYAVDEVIHFPFYKDRLLYPFFGHCHGIVCISLRYVKVILCNSATREFRELPVSCFHPSPGSEEVVCLPLGFGFGYDPKTNDYKVVRILYFIDNPGCESPIKVEMYTLSTDSWRKVNINLFAAGICFLQRLESLYFNRAFHWMAWGDFHESDSFILSFDISDETFKKIAGPSSTLNARKDSRELIVLNESLAFVLHDASAVQSLMEIWIMDEVGVKAKWKKLLTIEGNSRLQKPLVFWKSDELVMEDKTGKFCRYNLRTGEIKDLPVRRRLRKYSAVNYLSSLVSVRAGNKLDLGNHSLT